MATALLSTPLAARATRRSTRGRAAVAPRASLEVVHAAQEVAQLASDNRPLLLLGLGLPVLGYVAFNIGLPALRQLQGMVEEAPAKGKAKLRSVAALTGLAAALAASNDAAQAAQEVSQLAADNRPFLLLGLGLPVLGYVAFNIGLPALRQLQGMVEDDKPKGKKR